MSIITIFHFGTKPNLFYYHHQVPIVPIYCTKYGTNSAEGSIHYDKKMAEQAKRIHICCVLAQSQNAQTNLCNVHQALLVTQPLVANFEETRPRDLGEIASDAHLLILGFPSSDNRWKMTSK